MKKLRSDVPEGPCPPRTDTTDLDVQHGRSRRLGVRGLPAASAYAVALGLSQTFVIAPVFEYYGYTSGTPSVAALVITCLSYLASASQLPRRLDRPSQITYWILFLLVVAPIHVTPLLLDLRGRPSPLPFVVTLSLCFVGLGLIYRLGPPRLVRLPVPQPLFRLVLGGTAVAGVALLAANFKLSFNVVGIGDVYGIREEYRDSLASSSGYLAYAVSWLAYILAPTLGVIGVIRRSILLGLSGIALAVLIYSFTGFKSVLFSGLFLLVFLLLSRSGADRMVRTALLSGAAAAVLSLTAFDATTGGVTLSSLFVRRLAHTAGLNSYRYYEFFSEHQQTHLTQSIFGVFGTYPYSANPPQLIGEVYFGSTATSANANLWADAYANFGLLGMVFFTAVLAMFLYCYDGIARTVNRRFAALLLAMPSFSLSNSALLTTLLTHGLLLAMIVVLVTPTELTRPAAPRSGRRARRRSITYVGECSEVGDVAVRSVRATMTEVPWPRSGSQIGRRSDFTEGARPIPRPQER